MQIKVILEKINRTGKGRNYLTNNRRWFSRIKSYVSGLKREPTEGPEKYMKKSLNKAHFCVLLNTDNENHESSR